MPALSANQLTLDFTPGLTERWGSALECVRERAYSHRNPLKTIAADMDQSLSELSRKLASNPEDTRRLSLDDFEAFLRATGDMTPIYYLIDKYLTDSTVKQKRAMHELSRQLPELIALMKAAGSGESA